MKNKLCYSPEAIQDLDEIWDYIMLEFCNPNAAEKIVNSIMNTIGKLEDFPEMGTSLSSVSDVESDYRFVTYGNYMAFYRHMNKDIFIDRILYGKRDYLRVLFDNPPDKIE